MRNLVIDRPNQVWAADIMFIPIGRGFLYLVAVIDWPSRAVLSWRLSNTVDAPFCVAALEEALARFGRPLSGEVRQSEPRCRRAGLVGVEAHDFRALVLDRAYAVAIREFTPKPPVDQQERGLKNREGQSPPHRPRR